MKSMVEEATSIAKAVENCWNRAGKPQEFTIKVLEYPEKNFLGLSKKPAKIALIYREQPAASETSKPRARQSEQPRRESRPTTGPRQQSRHPQPQHKAEQVTPETHKAPVSSEQRHAQAPREREQRSDRPQQRRTERRPYERPYREQREQPEQGYAKWTPEMVQAAQTWMQETLGMMRASDIQVNMHVSGPLLRVELNKPVDADPRQEEILFKSWTTLLFDALRSQFKDIPRPLRVIIESRGTSHNQ